MGGNFPGGNYLGDIFPGAFFPGAFFLEPIISTEKNLPVRKKNNVARHKIETF